METQGGYTSQFRRLFKELGRYLRLQKRYWALDAADKLIVLLSTVAIAEVCFVLGAMILFFLTFTAAYWLGGLMGNLVLGFLSIAVVLALLLYIFYRKRASWVVVPLARMVVGLFESVARNGDEKDETDEEEETNG